MNIGGRWLIGVLACGLIVSLWGFEQMAPAQRGDGAAADEAPADGAKRAAKKAAAAKKQAADAKKRAAAKQGAVKDPGAPPADDHPVADDPNKAPVAPTGPSLSSGDSYDDFCSVAEKADGTLYAAYLAYYDGHDQVRIHKKLVTDPGKPERWSTRTHMPLVEAEPDIWMPQLAVDAKDRLWVIWSEQVGRTDRKSGNWDLYARSLEDDGQRWGPIVRLTNDPKPDINHHVCVDSKGVIHVVWQAHPDNNGDVMLCRFDGEKWSKPLAVTTGSGADWYPRVAVDREGVEWIVFDSYRNGDYDVFLTKVDGDKPGDVIPIATSKFYEAHPTVACAADGKVWIAWEQGGWLWGKDQGHWVKYEKREIGTALGSGRNVKVAVFDGGKLLAAPAPPVPADARGPVAPDDPKNILPNRQAGGTAMAVLAADDEGRVWLGYRLHRRSPAGQKGRFKTYWTQSVTQMTADGWADAKELELSAGRISVFSRLLPCRKDGSLHVAYSADMRTPADYHQPIEDRAFVATLPKPEARPGAPELSAYEPPQAPGNAREFDFAAEKADLMAVRGDRREIDGVQHRIVRGDLHRHTEMSWDVGPGNDGSYLDFYRYMIDVASMDFGSLTDHQGGGQYAYHWWLTQKSADMYYLPPRFVPLYGYERSVKFPNGHRNVLHAYRGVPVFPFQLKLTQQGVFPGVSSGEVVENDTKLLYEFLRKTGGLAISHTSATDTMGTDWRDNDPEVEPVVEIYQGARNSSEVVGGPRVHPIDKEPADKAPGGYQDAGMVWNAWGKGYRLGSTSSSDHGSTHISYSLVYTPKVDRQEILDAIRKRQTYGATDNLIVSFEADGHFMGQEFTTGKPPALRLKVHGTGKIDRIDLIRNGQYIYASSPGKRDVDVTYTDMQPEAGTNYYYFRLLQDNGEVAWASPVWINFEGQ
ncbi:MAG TPA: hypothetical protein VHZ24_04915 [Pirellulales bacterium]|jgi:hypothetical protein|nr:hypothetical protein [Pirellulales bacterium]